MSNHVHLLVKTGESVKLGMIMRRVLTGYALYFNRRYGRCGYLFQGRYKSTVCEEEGYLLRLVRYIHLNPYRARMVTTLKELDSYRWSGHRGLIGKERYEFQDTEEIIGRFGSKKEYMEYIREGMGIEEDLEGGGLIRSLGGIGRAVIEMKGGVRDCYDQRVLGDGEFVEDIWEKLEEDGKQEGRISFEELVRRICSHCEIEEKKVIKWRKQKGTGRAKAIIVSLAARVLKIPGVIIGQKMTLTPARVSQLKYLGEDLFREDDDLAATAAGLAA